MLRRELELIGRLGVKMVFNSSVGADHSLNDLASQFDAVFLSIGTWKESWLYLPGTELKGVFRHCRSLKSVASRTRWCRSASAWSVIGGGNAAIDSARTVLRMGANVTIIYRRERKDMPAIDEEIQAAEDEGVRIVFLAAPHRIIGDAARKVKAIEMVKTRLGEYDTSGRTTTHSHRRSSTLRVRQRDPGRGRNLRPAISAVPPALNSKKKALLPWIDTRWRPAGVASMPAAM